MYSVWATLETTSWVVGLHRYIRTRSDTHCWEAILSSSKCASATEGQEVSYCSSLKSRLWWYHRPHTSQYMVLTNPSLSGCHQRLFLGFLGALHSIPVPLPTGLNEHGLTFSSPAASCTMLWEWSGWEIQADLSLDSLILFWSHPPSCRSISQIPWPDSIRWNFLVPDPDEILGLGFSDLFGFGSIIDGQGLGKRRKLLFILLMKIHASV